MADSESHIVMSDGAIFETPESRSALEQSCTVAEFFGLQSEEVPVDMQSSHLVHKAGRVLQVHAGIRQEADENISASFGYAVDVTPFIRSEEEFKLSVQQSRQPAFLVDAQSHFAWGNQAMLDRLGHGKEMTAGDPSSNLLHKIGAVPVERNPQPSCEKITFPMPDGDELDGYLFPVRRKTGEVVRCGILEATHLRDQSSTPLPAESYLAHCMKALPIHAYLKDSDLRFTWVSPAALRRMGLTLEQVVGRTYADLGATALAGLGGRQDAQVLAEQRGQTFDNTFTHEDGSPGRCVGYSFPVEKAGEKAVGGAFIDKSEETRLGGLLSERDAFWNALFDHSPTAHVIADLDLKITDANGAFADLLGSCRSSLRGQHLAEVIPLAETDRERALLEDLLSGRRSQYRLDKKMARSSGGAVVAISALFTMVRSADRAPHAVLVMINTVQAQVPTLGQNPRAWDEADLRLLTAVAGGASDSQAARLLRMGESTVRLRLSRLKRRLGATNRAHLVARAYEKGLLPARSPQSLEDRSATRDAIAA
ncbi:PAS domain-containing protein [Streptomyces formicae]|uniref:PAS domain-containing protein n=1 Tax=Streptomyces formicae TaxID=1616117 RepID=A0ABY3WLR3_9ACTN|nr:PAS domain-containing protein [Streptomyces formicae]UNM12277.1 PAS domain-containing protein [Streptomyces formicae]